MHERESSADIDRAAAQWASRLDRGPLSAEEKAAMDLWLQADIRRRGALARAMAVSARFDDLGGPAEGAAARCGSHRPRG